ncbi:CheR family methyltransferase [Aestuariibacter salexigens]|uniref:CheR family methyltransferase n=1 Tax=Aestuariibacter salexigens TaxID=226010 RepID=UPI00041E51BE|nr:protein-glutamate O-methyltransferase CheR [Aestuariibacter salexigens]
MKADKEFDFSFKQFDRLRRLAHDYSGIHVTDDKYEMYYARLAKRLRALKLNNFTDYITRVEKDKDEFREFINAITTNVTAFEREPHHFAHLKQIISSWSKPTINIWSAGCSTGQEPYSILVNILPICRQKRINVKMLATDLDTDVLMKAKAGIYPLEAIDAYDIDTKRKFFKRGKGNKEGFCRVKPELTGMIDFKQLNLIYPWKMDQTFDCIFCRNVLIYFEMDKKLEILDRYAAQLAHDGTLFLGHSESIPRSDTSWQTIGKNMYQKRSL